LPKAYLIRSGHQGKDPTDGAVNYLSKQNAMAQGLATNTNNQIRLAVDSAKKVPASQGRPAVRLESVETFSSGLLVADIEHMPGNSCGTWPAMYVSSEGLLQHRLNKVADKLFVVQVDVQQRRG